MIPQVNFAIGQILLNKQIPLIHARLSLTVSYGKFRELFRPEFIDAFDVKRVKSSLETPQNRDQSLVQDERECGFYEG